MTDHPLVSVVIPARDAERFIGATLDSVLEQSYNRFEVIVVDDGSTDTTPNLVRAYAREDARVRLLQQPRAGVVRARNQGILASKGLYIAPLDADDVWFRDKLAKQVALLERSSDNVGLVYCWSALIDAEDRLTPHWCAHEIEGEVLTSLILRNFVGNASAPMMRRHHLERAGGYNPRLRAQKAEAVADWDLYLRLAEWVEFRVVPEILMGYRQHPGNLSSNLAAMGHAHRVLMEAISKRHPDLPENLFRWSAAEFSFYLALLSGSYHHDWRTSLQWLRHAVRQDLAFAVQPRFYRQLAQAFFLRLKPAIPALRRTRADQRRPWNLSDSYRAIARSKRLALDRFQRRMPREVTSRDCDQRAQRLQRHANATSIDPSQKVSRGQQVNSSRVLITGWFSFRDGHATAGDLLARDLVRDWLKELDCDIQIATDRPFVGGIDWRQADPANFDRIVFVCGPFHDGPLERDLLSHFRGVPVIGVNLSMVQPLADFNPFQVLFERDSMRQARPDLVFATQQPLVPLLGVCLVEDYPAGHTHEANAAIERLIDSRELAVVPIDTRLDENRTGLRTPGEIESLLARMDVVITTRLHGTVLALKNSVPVIAIDPEPGGFKIKRQGELLGWPCVFAVDQLRDHDLSKSLDYCLTPVAKEEAGRCATRANEIIAQTKREFQSCFSPG